MEQNKTPWAGALQIAEQTSGTGETRPVFFVDGNDDDAKHHLKEIVRDMTGDKAIIEVKGKRGRRKRRSGLSMNDLGDAYDRIFQNNGSFDPTRN